MLIYLFHFHHCILHMQSSLIYVFIYPLLILLIDSLFLILIMDLEVTAHLDTDVNG